ncbi:hypothetical protein QQ045_021724 [Rhodiola kirilowii]
MMTSSEEETRQGGGGPPYAQANEAWRKLLVVQRAISHATTTELFEGTKLC